MVKFIVSLLILVILALGAVLLVRDDPGFLLLRYRDYSVETTLAFGLVAADRAGYRILLWPQVVTRHLAPAACDATPVAEPPLWQGSAAAQPGAHRSRRGAFRKGGTQLDAPGRFQ